MKPLRETYNGIDLQGRFYVEQQLRYRRSGCPFGDTMRGFLLWMAFQQVTTVN